MMRSENLKASWMNIDKAEDPHRFVRLMDRARGGTDNDASQYQMTIDLLNIREGDRVLDVGCGTGGAAQVLARLVGGSGKVVGFDSSSTMIAEAKSRTDRLNLAIEFRQGDAHRLPFPDNYFDCCLALRFLDIIANPSQALKEIFRVTRSGGRVYVNGPDIDMWTFDAVSKEVTRKIVHYICDHEVNGWIGRQLDRHFRDGGLSEIKVLPLTHFSSDFNLMYDLYLRGCVDRARKAQAVSRPESTLWLKALKQRCAGGSSACSQTIFRVVGTKV